MKRAKAVRPNSRDGYHGRIAPRLDTGLYEDLDFTLPRHAFVRGLMGRLIHCGFARVRYYELDFNVPRAASAGFEDLAVLADSLEAEGEPIGPPVGYTILWHDTASFRVAAGLRVVVAEADSFDVGLTTPSWIADLHMSGRSFADIPVLRNGEPRGLLAVDWFGHPSDLAGNERSLLDLVGQAIGSVAEADEAVVSSLSLEGDRPLEIVQNACVELMDRIDAAFAAIFEFQWTDRTLAKVCEYFQRDKQTPPILIEMEEPRYAVGSGFLTGRAWTNESVRYVADLAHLRKVRPDWIQPGSFEDHTRLSGVTPTTVLYSDLGSSEKRYLLRFINRCDEPVLPFLKRRRQILDRFSQDLEIAVDLSISRHRLSSLRSIAASVVRNIRNPQAIVELVDDAMSEERIDDYCFLATPVGMSTPTLVHAQGLLIQDTAHPDFISALLEYARREDEHARMDRKGTPRATHAPWSLSEFDGLTLLVTSSLAGGTLGVVALAVDGSGGTKESVELPLGRGEQVRAYCDLVTSAMEGQSSYISEDGARRALGYIGHEIGTPFTILGDSAIAVALEGIRISRSLSSVDPGASSALLSASTKSYQRIQKSRDEIDRVMEIAPILASMGSGTLKMFLQPVDLAQIANEARKRISTEMRGTQPVHSGIRVPSRSRKFTIDNAESLQRLPIIGADEGLLLQALLNLLRNAVKYSLPRYPPNPMRIVVAGRTLDDGRVALTVENWGFGIPTEMQSTVFLPFVRGQIEDRMKSLPGMGLGLYLVRTIVAAHGGTVGCRSVPTLDDPKRTEAMEGWLTTFELRLPSGLRTGHRAIEVDPYRAQSTKGPVR